MQDKEKRGTKKISVGISRFCPDGINVCVCDNVCVFTLNRKDGERGAGEGVRPRS